MGEFLSKPLFYESNSRFSLHIRPVRTTPHFPHSKGLFALVPRQLLEQRRRHNAGLRHSTLSLPLGTTLSGTSATRRSTPTSRRQCTPASILRSRVPHRVTRTKLLKARTCFPSDARLSGAKACRLKAPHNNGLFPSRSLARRQLRRTPPHRMARVNQPGDRHSPLRTVSGSRGRLTGSNASARLRQTMLESARITMTMTLQLLA
jgi:hypothetical protein